MAYKLVDTQENDEEKKSGRGLGAPLRIYTGIPRL